MKRIFIMVIAVILFIGIVGCSKRYDPKDKTNVNIVKEQVTMSIKENTLTKESATLIIKNNSKENIVYGYPFTVEQKINDKWEDVNLELAFVLPAFSLKSNESVEMEVNWGRVDEENRPGYKELKPGMYRIVKEFSIQNDNDTYEDFKVYCEFSL